jgi:molybdopterin converting factor small subunit
MQVIIPSPLHAYTAGRSLVEGRGATLAELLDDLDARFPGIRFRVVNEQDRIREHIRFFVDGELARDLSHPLAAHHEVFIACALSGG